MPSTARGYPYQSHSTSPDGADLGEDLAQAIDADMTATQAALQADIDANEADIATVEDQLAAGYLYQQTVVISANGTFDKGNYPGLRAVRIHCYGAGGAGGGAQTGAGGASSKGAGGGSGAYSVKWVLAASLSASETVTIGTGGTGSSAANGNNGSGNTSLGTHCVAVPGNGGQTLGTSSSGGAALAGAGGAAASGTGDIKISGTPGGNGYGTGALAFGGNGGLTPGPHGGPGGLGRASTTSNVSLAGNPGQAPGGGGGGALVHTTGGSQAGGAGANGQVVVDIFV